MTDEKNMSSQMEQPCGNGDTTKIANVVEDSNDEAARDSSNNDGDDNANSFTTHHIPIATINELANLPTNNTLSLCAIQKNCDITSIICESVSSQQLNDQFSDHELHNINISENNTTKCSNSSGGTGEGSDSGVETGIVNGSLKRVLSNNSGGYASSCCGGLEESTAGGNASCNSSMISCCSDFCENKPVNILRHNSMHDCTSEGGSESSSITGGTTRRSSAIKKKVALTEPNNSAKSERRDTNSVARSRSRAASANRAAVQTKVQPPPTCAHDRGRSREKPPIDHHISSASSKSIAPQNRSTPIKRPSKPDKLPTGSKESISTAMHRAALCRTPSINRGRTPGSTPTIEDGRWPSLATPKSVIKSNRTGGGSVTPENIVIKTKAGPISLDFKSSSIDKYATLPRRRKEKSDEDLFRAKSIRSTSAQRDRMTSSVVVKRQLSKESTPAVASTPTKPMTQKSGKKTMPKTRIYHETSVQTAITCKDIADAFAGVIRDIRVDGIEFCDRASQVDIRDREIERLESQVKQLNAQVNGLQETVAERSQSLTTCEQQLSRERDEKLALEKEMKSNTERVMGMLALVHIDAVSPVAEDNCDSLLMLESQIQQSGHALEAKQMEIDKLHSFCSRLQVEMQRSINVQQNLKAEQAEFEKESSELQDFLQDEKSALMEALKETELELDGEKKKCEQKDVEIERLQEECRHLVRISEQRRQEYLGLQSKYTTLESRSKELIVQQSSAVSGASMALAGLGSRLDNLVGQLISSYNISEQELEDVIFHNEAYTNSGGSSADMSPDTEIAGQSKILDDTSPQRHQSFVAAVINAIKSAATTAKHSVHKHQQQQHQQQQQINGNGGSVSMQHGNGLDDESDSTEMLDSETEPCLMMEHVLEDVSMPDSHSHNLVSSSGMMSLSQQPMVESIVADKEEDSLYNLSQAIANRQQIELQANRLIRNSSEPSTCEDISQHESIAEPASLSEFCSAQALVDQVIEVDNLVTKLLKVLRIIQMDNDNCIQQLIGDKNKLQLNKEEMMEKLKDWEDIHLKLKRELEDASHQLIVNSSDLANSKIELQRHRAEIDRLNVDICNLSTLCSNKSINKDNILYTLKMWQENKAIPEPEILSHIVTACQEIPFLKDKLMQKDRQLNDLTNNSAGRSINLNEWQQAIVETKRQYEAIDRALETLSSIQTIVQQCPALAALQRDLEETNFQSAATIPVYSALLTAATNNGHHHNHHRTRTSSDCNANADDVVNNGSTNGSASGVLQLKNGDSPSKNTIDSTA